MYKTILVPLDGSKRAESILPHVADLAGKYQATVVLLIVEEPPLLIEYDEAIQVEQYIRERESSKTGAQSYLDSVAQKLRVKGISTETRLSQGPVVKTIINTADQIGANLVAMTSHGLSGLERAFYGSVAAGVLQYIDRPLLLIRSDDS